MNDYQKLRNNANQLRKAQRYKEAVQLYSQLWNNFRKSCNEWDGWGYAYCLQKLRLYKDALEICREVFRINPNFSNIKYVYAWSIYYTEIKKEKIEDEALFIKAAEAITQLCQQDDKYSPYNSTIFRVIEYYKNKTIPNSDKILEWLNKLDPTNLETKPYQIIDENNKKRELASMLEQYFMFRSTALYDKNMWVECIDCCEQALKKITKFHYNNDVWFKRRIALSLWKIGNTEKALSFLLEILQFKKEWFIQYEIAELLLQKGEIETALDYALDAVLNYGDLEKKLNLIMLLAEILKLKGENEITKKHILLVYLLRKTKGWKIPQHLIQLIEDMNINTQGYPGLNELESELRKTWLQLKFENKQQYTGKIKTILPNNFAGFIELENGETYYFSAKEFIGNKNEMRVGAIVTFYLEAGYDRKKNKRVKNAIKVRVKS